MSRIAVPQAIEGQIRSQWKNLPPGHKFLLYWDGWQSNYQKDKKGINNTLKRISALGDGKYISQNLIQRQAELFKTSNNILHIRTTATAPFTTGLGEDHPLENGFAFLHPYGVPYYPGSGIKGAVRAAAETMALFMGDRTWTLPLVWWLFGFDQNSAWFFTKKNLDKASQEMQERYWIFRLKYFEHMQALRTKNDGLLTAFAELMRDQAPKDKQGLDFVDLLTQPASSSPADKPEFRKDLLDVIKTFHLRGSLVFYDCFPQIPQKGLRVDILNPHHRKYYMEGKTPPGTFESPVPVYFLTLPPGTKFNYYVEIKPVGSLPDPVKDLWQDAVSNAFLYAYKTRGIGAKTAMGYGIQRHEGQNTAQKVQQNRPGKPEPESSITAPEPEPQKPRETRAQILEDRAKKQLDDMINKQKWGDKETVIRTLMELKAEGGNYQPYVERLFSVYRKKFKKHPKKAEKFRAELVQEGLLNG